MLPSSQVNPLIMHPVGYLAFTLLFTCYCSELLTKITEGEEICFCKEKELINLHFKVIVGEVDYIRREWKTLQVIPVFCKKYLLSFHLRICKIFFILPILFPFETFWWHFCRIIYPQLCKELLVFLQHSMNTELPYLKSQLWILGKEY